MQSENEINDQFRVLKAKSSKTKPFGFAMIVAGEDGKPLIYFDRKINGARASAKAELKTAKKNLEADNHKMASKIKKSKVNMVLLLARLLAQHFREMKTKRVFLFFKNRYHDSHLELQEVKRKEEEERNLIVLRRLVHVVKHVLSQITSKELRFAVSD